jgi:origin recognition complex subunit 5
MVLSALLRLQQLTNRRVCVVLLSQVSWIAFRDVKHVGTGVEPLIVHIPYPDPPTLVHFLLREHSVPVEENPTVQVFVETLVDVFGKTCKDVSELSHLCKTLYPAYVKPIHEGTIARHDTAKLFQVAQQLFTTALEGLYMRDTSQEHLELPFYTKYLLVAAYVASNNPSKKDQDMFMHINDHHNKKAKRGRKRQLFKDDNDQLDGSKSFSFDRWMTIFYSLIEGNGDVDVDENLTTSMATLYRQIHQLASNGLVTRLSPFERLEDMRFKCEVSHQLMQTVASSIGMELNNFIRRLP